MKPNYIEVRIEQLKEELDKMSDHQWSEDMVPEKTWYNRIIQELTWAKEMQEGNVTRNCFMEEAI